MYARHDYYGVFADAASRAPRDVAGESMQLKVHIVDRRPLASANGSVVQYGHSGPYKVNVMLKEVGIWEMNMGPEPIIGASHTQDAPGSFVVSLPCPKSKTTATVHIVVSDAHGFQAVDEFALSFHMHYYKLLKWMVALPMVASGVVVLMLLASDKPGLALPS